MRQIVCFALNLYWFVLLVRIVMSWFPIEPGGMAERAYGVLYALTEPVLRPVRNMFRPVRAGGAAIDLSPIVVFLVIMVLQRIFC